MITISFRRRCKLFFGAPGWCVLKGGSQGIKESQDGGLIQSRASLGSIGYSYGWGITIRHKDLCSRLLTGWIIYKELKYFVRIGLRFKLSSLGSSTFNSRHVGTDGIRKCDDWTSLHLVLWQLKWVNFVWKKFSSWLWDVSNDRIIRTIAQERCVELEPA